MREMEDASTRFLRDAHILARLVEQIFERGYLRQVAGPRLTFDQLNVLKFLNRPGLRLVRDVSHFLNASYAAASKAVTRLERKGLVTRSNHPHDRRAERLDVTPKGKHVIGRYEELKKARLRELARDEDLDGLSKALETVIALLMRERSSAGNPCLGCGAYYARECVVRAHGQHCRCTPGT